MTLSSSAEAAPLGGMADQVDFLNGRTRLFGIVGHPIEQVRSPEMFTAEFQRRGWNALMLPVHVLPDDFDIVLPSLMRLQNLDGLIFTIPFKVRAAAFADLLGEQALAVGAINALVRAEDGRWRADIFDGIGCVEAFRRRGYRFEGQRVMLIGSGGAGTAIGVAVACEKPEAIRVFDLDGARAEELARRISGIDPTIQVEIGSPSVEGRDVLLNASPVGMLGDDRRPIDVDHLPSDLIVFDAIVKPDRTQLLDLAERCGCRTVYGREMMRGQISKMADFFSVA